MRRSIGVIFVVLAILVGLEVQNGGILYPSQALAAEKWEGVDKSVVEKIAKEHGREASEPLINTDKGDLLLFVFLLAGTAAGFAGGYYWRMLTAEKAPKRADEVGDNKPRNE